MTLRRIARRYAGSLVDVGGFVKSIQYHDHSAREGPGGPHRRDSEKGADTARCLLACPTLCGVRPSMYDADDDDAGARVDEADGRPTGSGQV